MYIVNAVFWHAQECSLKTTLDWDFSTKIGL